GLVVLAGIPLIHAVEQRIGLLDGQRRPFGEHVQLGVGDDGGNFDDHVLVRIQTGHFQVDPDQVIWVLHSRSFAYWRRRVAAVYAPRATLRRILKMHNLWPSDISPDARAGGFKKSRTSAARAPAGGPIWPRKACSAATSGQNRKARSSPISGCKWMSRPAPARCKARSGAAIGAPTCRHW